MSLAAQSPEQNTSQHPLWQSLEQNFLSAMSKKFEYKPEFVSFYAYQFAICGTGTEQSFWKEVESYASGQDMAGISLQGIAHMAHAFILRGVKVDPAVWKNLQNEGMKLKDQLKTVELDTLVILTGSLASSG